MHQPGTYINREGKSRGKLLSSTWYISWKVASICLLFLSNYYSTHAYGNPSLFMPLLTNVRVLH